MKITYWSDFACPFCYIGENRLEKAIQKLNITDIDLEFKSFELDPNADKNSTHTAAEHLQKSSGAPLNVAKQQIAAIEANGRADGFEFNLTDAKYTNTFDAHRLAQFVKSKGDKELEQRVLKRLFRAFFVDGQELNQHETLVTIAVQEGLDEVEVRQLLEGNAYADAVRADERSARESGVSRVPFFVINNKYAISEHSPRIYLKRH